MKFVDRFEELETLRERLDSSRFELIVIYGRRRIGKTRLILEALKGREYIYYLAVESNNLRRFKEVAAKIVPEIRYTADDWEAVLYFLKNRIIVIDEFPNMIKEDKAVVSLIQRIVDLELASTRTKLVLLGSSISMIESHVLSYRSPLYGRRTSTMRLRPLRFVDIRGFFPKASWHELVEIYGFTDGIPFYLERVSYPFWRWLKAELRKPDSFLRYEVDFLLRYEFEETSMYRRILEALAFGRTKLGEIRDYVGARRTDITPYLRKLIETGFVRREVPVTESLRSRRGRYYISDNFLNFWFRFIYPNLSAIEEGIFNYMEIKRKYNEYLGSIFEKIARELIIELAKRGKLPLKISKLGRWWRRDIEIDIVALSGESPKILFIEAKWSKLRERDVYRLLALLEKKAGYVDWNIQGRKEYYAIVAREIEGKNKLRNKLGEEVMLLDLLDFDIINEA